MREREEEKKRGVESDTGQSTKTERIIWKLMGEFDFSNNKNYSISYCQELPTSKSKQTTKSIKPATELKQLLLVLKFFARAQNGRLFETALFALRSTAVDWPFCVWPRSRDTLRWSAFWTQRPNQWPRLERGGFSRASSCSSW